jgi:hypothetical protein
MRRPSNTLSDLRMAAVCFLSLWVFLGPAGLATAFAGEGCVIACACDAEASPPLTSRYAKNKPGTTQKVQGVFSEHVSEHSDDDHSSDPGCPDDCPSCSAGMTVALASTLLVLPKAAFSMTRMCLVDPGGMPATGTGAGIYRPPRTLS